jgi:hypothetical protein
MEFFSMYCSSLCPDYRLIFERGLWWAFPGTWFLFIARDLNTQNEFDSIIIPVDEKNDKLHPPLSYLPCLFLCIHAVLVVLIVVVVIIVLVLVLTVHVLVLISLTSLSEYR